MISFFKNKGRSEVNDNLSYTKIAALLIHTAKIDEAYDEKEKDIIKKTLILTSSLISLRLNFF